MEQSIKSRGEGEGGRIDTTVEGRGEGKGMKEGMGERGEGATRGHEPITRPFHKSAILPELWRA